MIPLLLLACAPAPEPVDPGPAAEALDLPDTTGVDFAAAYTAMLELALQVRLDPAWAGHLQALGAREPGCPDLYAGWPEEDMDQEGGLSWMDRCTTRAGLDFGGLAWWDAALVVEQDEASGTTTTGSRALVADGVVSAGDEVLYELDGELEDGLLRIEDGDYTRWSYNSALDATVTGTWPFGAGALAGGWRTQLSLSATGGDDDGLALSGIFYSPSDTSL